jgi:hypothetical protein
MCEAETRQLSHQQALISTRRIRIDEHPEPSPAQDLECSPRTPHADLFDVRAVPSQACLQDAEDHRVVFDDQYVAGTTLRGWVGTSQVMQIEGLVVVIAHNPPRVVEPQHFAPFFTAHTLVCHDSRGSDMRLLRVVPAISEHCCADVM